MPTSANVTSTPTKVHTFPKGSISLIVQNESDTPIRVRFGGQVTATAAAGTADTGFLIAAAVAGVPGELIVPLTQPLKEPLGLHAVQGGGGNKLLTLDAIVLPLLALLCVVALTSCGHWNLLPKRTPMVKTTTTMAMPEGALGAPAGAIATTVTEAPYEPPIRTAIGEAGRNLFHP